jgi:hypothetical protein
MFYSIDGFTSILTAVHQLTVFEIIMGESGQSFKPRELLRQFPNGAKYLNSRSMNYGILGVGKVDWERVTMEMIMANISE